MNFVIGTRTANALKELGLISDAHDTSNMTHMEAMHIIIRDESLNNVVLFGDFSGFINNSDHIELATFTDLDDMLTELIFVEYNYRF